jgi:hypothetical protein
MGSRQSIQPTQVELLPIPRPLALLLLLALFLKAAVSLLLLLLLLPQQATALSGNDITSSSSSSSHITLQRHHHFANTPAALQVGQRLRQLLKTIHPANQWWAEVQTLDLAVQLSKQV